MEEVTRIDCYQCREDHKTSPTEIKQAVSGPLFPFCSLECKDKWGLRNFGQVKNKEHKYKTIEECQQRLEEIRLEKFGQKKQIEDDNQPKDLYDVAKMIFG